MEIKEIVGKYKSFGNDDLTIDVRLYEVVFREAKYYQMEAIVSDKDGMSATSLPINNQGHVQVGIVCTNPTCSHLVDYTAVFYQLAELMIEGAAAVYLEMIEGAGGSSFSQQEELKKQMIANMQLFGLN